jgi:triosephosphate isomerase
MKPIIVANWKMNPQSLLETRKLFNSIKNWIKKNFNILQNTTIIICPPFVYLEPLSKLLKNKNFKLKTHLGAQNLFWEEKGAFTGEISPKMLKNLGVEYVIIGHSERRKILRESDEIINKKIKAAIVAKLKPILCIGETLKERKKGKTFKVLKNQLTNALGNFKKISVNQLIVAYEPVWAIGTGIPCKPVDAKKILFYLRKFTQPLFRSATQLAILYGGSVNSQNAKNYIKIGFDGLLVGGASLNPKEFIQIVKSVSKI